MSCHCGCQPYWTVSSPMVTALMSQVCCGQVPAVLPALAPLRFHQNIPIASFIFLSGRCGFCTARISPRYPVVEVIAAVSAVMLGVVYEPDWQLAAVMLFACALLTLSLIDIDHQVLPDLLVLPLLWTGLLFNSLSLFVDLHSGCIWRRCRVSGAVVVLPGASSPDRQSGYGSWRFQIVRRDRRLAPVYRCCQSCLRWRVSPVCYFWCTASVFMVRICGPLYVSAPFCRWRHLQRYLCGRGCEFCKEAGVICVKSGVGGMGRRRRRERPGGAADGPVLGDGAARPVPGSWHSLLFQAVGRHPPEIRWSTA